MSEMQKDNTQIVWIDGIPCIVLEDAIKHYKVRFQFRNFTDLNKFKTYLNIKDIHEDLKEKFDDRSK